MKITFNYKGIIFEDIVENYDDVNMFGKLVRSAAFALDYNDIDKSVEIYKEKTQEAPKPTKEDRKAQLKREMEEAYRKNVAACKKQAAAYNAEPVDVKEELASEGQKKYMDKLGIDYDENTTKIEAIDLINDYKRANNIPVRGNARTAD